MTAHWHICTDCPAVIQVFLPLFEIWVPVIIHQQCNLYDYTYTEWREFPKPASGALSLKFDDVFAIDGAGSGQNADMEADGKRFIGSSAPGFDHLLAELIDSNEAHFWRGRVNGKPIRSYVLTSPNLPPHSPVFPEYGDQRGIFTYGAMASESMPQALTNFLSNPQHANFTIAGGSHSAELLWVCCPDTKHHKFETQAD